MKELEELTARLGGASDTARALKITQRSYRNYLTGQIPESQRQHIRLLLAMIGSGQVTKEELISQTGMSDEPKRSANGE